jgi:signal transduction histidine kinase
MASRQILISTRGMEGGAVEVMVKDKGHGILPTDSVRLFEPFYTTKESGLGLGLSICSTIIETHGGQLTLVNDDDGGAIATFSLPAQKTAAGPAQSALGTFRT